MNEEKEILKRLRVLQASLDYLVNHLNVESTTETLLKLAPVGTDPGVLLKAHQEAFQVGVDFYNTAKSDAENAPD